MSSDEDEAWHMIVVKSIHRLGESLFLEVRCPPQEAFHWWRGEHSADPAVRPIVECSVGVSPGQEGIVLRIKRQTHDFWSQQKKAYIDYRPIWKVQSQSIESKDIKWSHLVLVRVPPLNSSVMYPSINFWHFDSCGRRKNNLVRAFPEGLKRLASRYQCFYQDLCSWFK